ncbi:hypothetical protein ACFLYN_05600 [Chloroflexota bacterium]
MKNMVKKIKEQRGSAFMLVLIALMLGTLVVTPTLRYVSTGMIEAGVIEDTFIDQYSADAVVEYTLWQLLYDDVADSLSLDNPSTNTTITINGMDIPTTTKVSYSPQDEEGNFSIPGYTTGIHLAAAVELLPITWSGAGQKTFISHIVYIYNCGTATAHPKGLFQYLDPNLKYVEGSYNGPDADLTKSWVVDHWELNFDFTNPLPTLQPGDITVITFTTWAKKDMGEYTFITDGYITYAGFQEDTIYTFSGESGLASFGLYDIEVTCGDYTYLVNVGVTETGEIAIRSWQVVQ